ncbi:MAG: hypothetical protein P8J37_19250 [Fuerstiella sp.]|jgi:hypothetical protein|nr:hypothetical protein [Fuerstiella sp.]
MWSITHISDGQPEPQHTAVFQQKMNNTSKPIGKAFCVNHRVPGKRSFAAIDKSHEVLIPAISTVAKVS